MRLLLELLAAVAAAEPSQFSLFFMNKDDEHKMAVYYKPHGEMEKLQAVMETDGADNNGDRYRLLGYTGHQFVVRSSDMTFRAGVSVTENEDWMEGMEGHKYKISFENLAGDDTDASMEVHSNGYIWVDPGKTHQFFSNENHEFILRNAANKPKVGINIVQVESHDAAEM
jgi:hypothetical protein